MGEPASRTSPGSARRSARREGTGPCAGTAEGAETVTRHHLDQRAAGMDRRDSSASARSSRVPPGNTHSGWRAPPGSCREGLPAAAEANGLCWASYDRPGYGGSGPHDGRSVASAAADVAAIADALGIVRFAVLGHSGGGPQPSRVSSWARVTSPCSTAASPWHPQHERPGGGLDRAFARQDAPHRGPPRPDGLVRRTTLEEVFGGPGGVGPAAGGAPYQDARLGLFE
jgi:hypothetical protein